LYVTVLPVVKIQITVWAIFR